MESNDDSGLEARIRALKPTNKAARFRRLAPTILAKLEEGVAASELLNVLNQGGLELDLGTFRTYLSRYRKQQKSVPVASAAGAQTETVSYDTNVPPAPVAPLAPTSRTPLSPQELHALIHPDPAQQAEEMAGYERLAKEAARARRRAQNKNAG